MEGIVALTIDRWEHRENPSNTTIFFSKTTSWLRASYMFGLHGRHL